MDDELNFTTDNFDGYSVLVTPLDRDLSSSGEAESSAADELDLLDYNESITSDSDRDLSVPDYSDLIASIDANTLVLNDIYSFLQENNIKPYFIAFLFLFCAYLTINIVRRTFDQFM